MKILVLAISLGILQVTSYRSVPKQTDDSPTWTSIGDRTTMFGVAVSQDYLKSGVIHYGDVLYVDGYGFRVVNDCMNKRYTHSVDLFVRTLKEEKSVGVQHKEVWIIRSNLNAKENSQGSTHTSRVRR